MAKILFDIAAAQEPVEWVQAHLVMEISHHIFSYTLINADKKILQLRFYEMEAMDNPGLAEELATILGSDEIILAATEKKTLIYNFPESQLVPEKYFEPEAGKELVELLHGDLNGGITLSERIQGADQYNVYRVPLEIHNLLQNNFTDSQYWHYYSLWLGQAQRPAGNPASCLQVLFYPNRMLVSVIKEQQLHLLQSYAYEAAEDVGYYLLNICSQLQLTPEDIPVVLSGMIDVSSVLYGGIYKYFGQVSLEPLPGIEPVPALEEYPPHFFSPLLKMAICVS